MTRLIILCLAWMALSAAIAYLADGAGRKLGKKRLTVFGLRPKHTAILITTSTGALIALFSFGVLMAASASIREALWRWDQTVAANEFLKAEQQRLSSTNRDLSATSERAQREARENLEKAEKAARERANAESRSKALTAAITQSERILSSTERELREQSQELNEAARQLKDTKTTLARQQKQVGELTATRKSLERKAAILSRSNNEMLQDNFRLASANRRLGAMNEAIRTGNVAALADEELVRVVVPPNQSVSETRVIVTKALWKAAEIVVQRNRMRDVAFPDNVPPVTLSVVRTVTENDRTLLKRFPPERARDDVARSISVSDVTHPGGVVMLVFAKSNTMMGEPVPVDFKLFKNRLIFEKFEVAKKNWIAMTEIDGSGTKEAITREIEELLMQVRKESVAHGLMPAADGSFGSIRPEQIFDVISEIRKKNRVVPVAAAAQEDTWTAGPLVLRFRVDDE